MPLETGRTIPKRVHGHELTLLIASSEQTRVGPQNLITQSYYSPMLLILRIFYVRVGT